MKKLIFLLLLIPSIVFAGFSVDGVSSPAKVDGVSNPVSVYGVIKDYSDIKLWVNAEGTWVGDPTFTYTLGSSECNSFGDADQVMGLSGTDFYEETSSPIVGDSSFRNTNASDYGVLTYSSGETLTFTKGRVGMHSDTVTQSNYTTTFDMKDTAVDNRIWFNICNSNKFCITIKTEGTVNETLESTTSDFDSATHFVELAFDMTLGAGLDYVIMLVDGVVEDYSYAETLDETGTFKYIYIGNINATGTGSLITDQYIISTNPYRKLYSLRNLTSYPTGACP